MALQKGIVSINMGNGIDTKDDQKVGEVGTYLELKDFTWNKLKRLDKRPGTIGLSTNRSGPSISLPFTQSAQPSSVFAHQDQLCVEHRGHIYSYNELDETWIYKGAHLPVNVSTKNVIATTGDVLWQSVSSVGNLNVYFYVIDNGPGNTGRSISLELAVADRLTGNWLANTSQISAYDSSTSTAYRFLGAGAVYFPQANTGLLLYNVFNSISAVPIDLETGARSLPIGIAADASPTGAIDFCYSNKAGVGERVFVSYVDNTGVVRVRAIRPDGTFDTTIGTATTAATASGGSAIHYNAATGLLYVAYATQTGNDFTSRVTRFDFTSSSITATTTNDIETLTNTVWANSAVGNFSITDDPLNLSQVRIFWTERRWWSFSSTNENENLSQADLIKEVIVSSTAIVSIPSILEAGLGLSGKAIYDAERSTIYLLASRSGSTQNGVFLLDVIRGPSVVARWDYGNHEPNVLAGPGSLVYSPVSYVANLGGGKFSFLTRTRTRIITSQNGQPLFQFGALEASFDLIPEFAPSRQFFAKNTYLSGGYLGLYDGQNVCEDNFFLSPEATQLQTVSSNNRMVITKIQDGTAGLPEITDIQLYCAPLIPIPATTSDPFPYWTFNTTSTAYLVYYSQPPGGTVPVIGGRANIAVFLNGNETANEVREKTVRAIQTAFGGSVAVNITAVPSSTTPGAFRMTNQANGSVVDTAIGTMTSAVATPAAGTYQFSACLSWLDQSGQVHRSAPSVPASITTTGRAIGVVVQAPAITNKTASSVRVELYRTQTATNTFYKTILFENEKVLSKLDRTTTGYVSVRTDASLAGQPLLYTTGGVLENVQLGPCTALSIFKNRLLVSNNDSSSLYYSKSGLVGEPAQFAAELFLQTDNDGQSIIGHAQLDDKLVVFKEDQIEYRAGDGANDLGANASWSLPILVATDSGCVNPNTIALFPKGLFFQSKLGLQVVNRAMQIEYIGLQVDEFNDNRVSRAQVLLDDSEVREIRFVLQDIDQALVYDYIVGRWGLFTQYGGTDAALWKGSFVRVNQAGRVWRESRAVFEDTGAAVPDYNPTLTTQWLKIKNVQDFQRVYRLSILGELKSPHVLRFRLYYDYDDSNYDEYNFYSSNITPGAPGDIVYQPQIHLSRQKCQSVKVEMTVLTDTTGSKECLTLTDMSFEVGMKQGLMKVKAGKRL